MIFSRLKKFFTRSLSALIVFSVILSTFFAGTLFSNPKKASAGYSPNGLCTDSGFTNAYSLDAQGIQIFLAAKGSFLASYSQGGRSAAQIIYDAARSYGINPIAVLATIQKEQGIVYGVNAGSFSQYGVDWAMGYGVPDSGRRNYSKQGFNIQVDEGTWQLRRNIDYWATPGSGAESITDEWNIGKTMNIDGTTVTFNTRCTSSLYRYTPHLSGNRIFNYYFNLWGGEGVYDGKVILQGPRSGPGSWGVEILPNTSFTVWVNYRNTGNSTWFRNWSNDYPNPTHFGTSGPQDRGSAFYGGTNRRGYLVQESVTPGGIGTFAIELTAPAQPGTYVEKFRPVIEHIKWFGDETVWTFNVSTNQAARGYNARYLSQGPREGAASLSGAITVGQQVDLWVNYLNTGTATWYNSGRNPVHLGTARPQDRGSVLFAGENRRGYLLQSSVPPGGVGTFIVPITGPRAVGNYTEHFQPVAEYITWFGDNTSWWIVAR